MLNKKNTSYDELEQYDYSDNEYLETVVDKYSTAIGKFLIRFSELEDTLNIAIAEFIQSETHEVGYVVIERLSTINKIDLFHKLYLRFVPFLSEKYKINISKINSELEEINSFRNSVVHANWDTLDKNGIVRAKIVVDKQEGFVKFKKVDLSLRQLTKRTKQVEKLTEQIFEFYESAFEDLLTNK